jgi:hypothetical protein
LILELPPFLKERIKMEKLTRQEAYAKSEEIYNEIRKEFESFLKQMKPKLEILKNFADEHSLIVSNPLRFHGDLEGAQRYVGKNYSNLPEHLLDEESEYLEKWMDGTWISSSDVC